MSAQIYLSLLFSSGEDTNLKSNFRKILLEKLMTIQQKAKTVIDVYFNKCIKNKNYSTSLIDKKSFNYEFTVTENSSKVKVQVYFGKKGVKTILQGNADTRLYANLSNLISGNAVKLSSTKKEHEPESYIGSDESGKGDIFGPLVTAGFFVNNEIKNELMKIGVGDSKLFSDQQINKMYYELEENLSDYFYVSILEPINYNQQYEKFNNLNRLLEREHSKVIYKLNKKFNCNFAIVDKFQPSKLNPRNYLMNEGITDSEFERIEISEFTKAERFVAVAAASIIARGNLNLWFEKNRYLGIPKGASLEAEAFLRSFMREHNNDELKRFGKLHFKSFQKFR